MNYKGNLMKNFLISTLIVCFFTICTYSQTNDRKLMAVAGRASSVYSGHLDGLLERLANAEYEYIIVEFRWENTYASNKDAYLDYHANKWPEVFKKAEKYNLKVIPMTNLVTKWGVDWRFASPYFNNFEMNSFEEVKIEDGVEKRSLKGCATVSADPNGVDAAFAAWLSTVKNAHKKSGVTHTIDFVHVDHNEPKGDNYQWLIGNPQNNTHLTSGKHSVRDRNAVVKLMNEGKSVSEAFQIIVSKGIKRKINQISAVFPAAKVMAKGDFFDPEGHGGVSFSYNGTKFKLVDRNLVHKNYKKGVKNNHGILSTLKSTLSYNERKKLIIVPWCYKTEWTWVGNKSEIHSYEPIVAFSYLADNGIPFMFKSAYDWNKKGFLTEEQKEDARLIADLYLKYAGKYPDYWNGVVTACWYGYDSGKTPYNQKSEFDLFEYMADNFNSKSGINKITEY